MKIDGWLLEHLPDEGEFRVECTEDPVLICEPGKMPRLVQRCNVIVVEQQCHYQVEVEFQGVEITEGGGDE